MNRHPFRAAVGSLCLLGGLTLAITPAFASEGDKCAGTSQPGFARPSPADPYPLTAAGWGPELGGGGLMASRWAEDWSGLRAADTAPSGKAIPFGRGALLTLSTEARWRLDSVDNGRGLPGNDFAQGLFRGVVGADIRMTPRVRIYGEVATGQVYGRREAATPNFQNAASLQQLFIDYRLATERGWLVGARIGRQEFADGPRQLISLSDGPNLHRTWNGIRLYAHGDRLRFGLFDFRVTRLAKGDFDEAINGEERIRGGNASFIVSEQGGPNTYLDPFWMRSDNANFQVGGAAGQDRRDTVGIRLWGRRSKMRFDWTAAHQSGEFSGRAVDAWALFAAQSFELSGHGWKPRLTSRLDLASGGGAYDAGTFHTFHPLYASSNYVGEGQFFSLSNIGLFTAGVSASPTGRTAVSLEYSVAKRRSEGDAVYAGGMRPYAGTAAVKGHDAGRLLRVTGSWTPTRDWTFGLDYERLTAGRLLRDAGFQSAGYAYLSATFRY